MKTFLLNLLGVIQHANFLDVPIYLWRWKTKRFKFLYERSRAFMGYVNDVTIEIGSYHIFLLWNRGVISKPSPKLRSWIVLDVVKYYPNGKFKYIINFPKRKR